MWLKHLALLLYVVYDLQQLLNTELCGCLIWDTAAPQNFQRFYFESTVNIYFFKKGVEGEILHWLLHTTPKNIANKPTKQPPNSCFTYNNLRSLSLNNFSCYKKWTTFFLLHISLLSVQQNKTDISDSIWLFKSPLWNSLTK